MRWLRENWIGFLIVFAVVVGLVVTYQQGRSNERANRSRAQHQQEFNLRTCQKGVELRDQANQLARVVNALKSSTATITEAAAKDSGDPSEARARYGALADQISSLPTVKELPPTDCPAIVKVYTPTP